LPGIWLITFLHKFSQRDGGGRKRASQCHRNRDFKQGSGKKLYRSYRPWIKGILLINTDVCCDRCVLYVPNCFEREGKPCISIRSVPVSVRTGTDGRSGGRIICVQRNQSNHFLNSAAFSLLTINSVVLIPRNFSISFPVSSPR